MKIKEKKGSFCQNSTFTPFQQVMHFRLKKASVKKEAKMFDTVLDRLVESIIPI